MEHPATWNPLTEWKPVEVDWIRVTISQEDMRRFTQRSNTKGLCQAIGFLLLVAATGTWAYWAFLQHHWILMAAALYFHGMIYKHFGDALHELSHNTVFSSRKLSVFFTTLYGLLYWVWNPHLYRISHQGYHHRYTLHQGSDGEDTPNYIEITPWLLITIFFGVFQIRPLFWNLGRLFTLKPTSHHWRGRGYRLDTWEQFILKNANDKDRRRVHRFAIYSLVTQVLFVATCVGVGLWIVPGLWFLPVLITLAPFYGPMFHGFMCGTHQHTACEANERDFRISCGDAILDPFSSFIYWHMEYHIEHHMFAAIPCYNLKKFRHFVADQLPPRQHSWPRLFNLNTVCREKYGSWQYWRDHFGRFKGF
jgi:fatty acid desaturase